MVYSNLSTINIKKSKWKTKWILIRLIGVVNSVKLRGRNSDAAHRCIVQCIPLVDKIQCKVKTSYLRVDEWNTDPVVAEKASAQPPEFANLVDDGLYGEVIPDTPLHPRPCHDGPRPDQGHPVLGVRCLRVQVVKDLFLGCRDDPWSK